MTTTIPRSISQISRLIPLKKRPVPFPPRAHFTRIPARMTHSYVAETPVDIRLDDGIKAYFEEFYKTSDTPDAHEKYADSFTSDATLVMASKKGVGREGNYISLFIPLRNGCSGLVAFAIEGYETGEGPLFCFCFFVLKRVIKRF
jgi:hypothetical protein